jgi:hypothetical protein
MVAPRSEEAAREAATLAELFADARRRAAAGPRPRFLRPAALRMAAYADWPEAAIDARLDEMAFWHVRLPSALAADPTLFLDVAARLPRSYRTVRDAVAEMRPLPTVVGAAFHMAAFPLLAALVARACQEVHGWRGHVLLARRNAAWLDLPSGRWIREVTHVLTTDPADLRRLVAGLRDGEIRRLFLLSDGPQAPGQRGVRAVGGPGSALGFSDRLLSRLLELAIPVRPVSHWWGDERLEIRWHPFVPHEPPSAGVDAIVELLEGLLRRNPEQWLNWGAATLRSSGR